jgi:electron transport complex protein RnfD
MRNVLIALMPVTVYGIVIFGLDALINVIVAVAVAELAEFVFRKAVKAAPRNGDLSAAVTGLLLALVIPPGTPFWMTALGAIFGIIVAKEFFGGLGANVFNPALAGRAFLLMSFPVALTNWQAPGGSFLSLAPDAVSAATPLVTQSHGGYWEYIQNLFFGYHAGSLGETSALLILAGGFFLLITRTIDWRAPVSMLAATALLSLILGVDPLVAVLSGGVLFGAVFMVTDYVSAPVTALGKLIFGAGAGIITVLIRQFGNYPEGVMYSILIMNAATPYLNKLIQRKYGFVKKAKPAKEAAK